mmetsp:Transcript_34968/g.93562  ORF Transcript_34968/g.93562 Transcript_34968/m.93562 type:complete len:148 (+) Transcript_34968:127-570(+)
MPHHPPLATHSTFILTIHHSPFITATTTHHHHSPPVHTQQSLFGALIKTPPPDISASSAYNVLTPDRLHRYTCTGTYAYAGVHFYGIEWDLWLHNALTFAMFDFWFKDTATSVVCTWAIYQILRFFRGYFGTANLANRTLVDSTFLI